MLDINLFREEKGHNPEIVRESQRRRCANVDLVDGVIRLDKEWRKRQFELDGLRAKLNDITKGVGQLKIANNAIVRLWGQKRLEPKLKNHVELVELLGIVDTKRGTNVAGGRGFYLKGAGVRLNQALINFGLDFLEKRGYTSLQTPFFMRKDIMAKVHQFEKVEQFCITSPNGNESWEMHEEMIKNSEEFYQMLKLPYQVVAIVSGALNDAAAKKYDLEAWFPASNTYRELVSCSNCTDYQSRRLEIRYGQKKGNEQAKQYVHLLNSTLTATERTLCCILENYQREDGFEIPEVLQDFMGGKTFMPFLNTPAKEAKGQKPNKAP